MLRLFQPVLNEEAINQELPRVFASGIIGSGPKVNEFTEELKKRFDCEEVIATNSCTSAIHQSLSIVRDAIGGLAGQRDIISTSLTCFAATSAIRREGFSPYWVDIDPNTFCLDLEQVKDRLSLRTRVVMWTSWGGVAPNYKKMLEISEIYKERYKRELYWILDLAHAFGTIIDGRQIPYHLKDNFFHCYSFGPIKTLTCGDGGALVCPSEFYEKAERMNWYGISRKNNNSFRAWSDIHDIGSKWNMGDINATIGLCNLRTVGYSIYRSHENVQFYLKNIKNNDITLLPAKTFKGTSGWLFTILVPDRQHFVNYMMDYGIECNGVHRPNHTLTCCDNFHVPLPNLDRLTNSYVCIPCGSWLKWADVKYITETINNYRYLN